MSQVDPSTCDRLRRYLGQDLWTADLSARWLPSRLGLRALRLVIVILRAVRDPQLNNEAMGLVYSTLLSVVPLLAVTFSVLKAFGADYRIEPFLARVLEPLGPRSAEVTERVIGFVGNMNVGVLGAVGLATLFYTVMSLIERIENALNGVGREPVGESRSGPGVPGRFRASGEF